MLSVSFSEYNRRTDLQYMGHVKTVAQMALNNSASHNLRVIIWDDMLRAISESDLRRTFC